jgi:hypothetical protein
MSQDLAQVHVSPLADAQQLRLVSSRVLAWNDAEPCGKLSALRKAAPLPRQRRWPLQRLGRSRESGGYGYTGLPLTPKHVDQVAHLWPQVGFCVHQNVRHGGLEVRWLLRKHHAPCSGPADLTSYGGARRYCFERQARENLPLFLRWMIKLMSASPVRAG